MTANIVPADTLRNLGAFLDALRDVEAEWGFLLDDELAVRHHTGGLLNITRIHINEDEHVFGLEVAES